MDFSQPPAPTLSHAATTERPEPVDEDTQCPGILQRGSFLQALRESEPEWVSAQRPSVAKPFGQLSFLWHWGPHLGRKGTWQPSDALGSGGG